DKVAAKILEGRVAVLVDGTPFALTMPYLFVEAFQANEDYYHHWLAATFHRIIRYSSFFLTTCTPALYLALVAHETQLVPMNLAISIAAARKNVPFPAMVEVIVMGFVFEVLREGGVRLPRPVGQAISIVGAIVLGDAAVGASLVSAPMIIVVGVTAVAGFVVAQLNDAAALIRLFLVLASAVLGLYGFLLGIMAIMIQLAAMKSFGVPYLSSFISLSAQGAKDTVLRAPWRRMIMRPRQLSEKNRKRMQSKSRSKNS
ncbi:MAG TPA: spore germination protein, partial [Limnochordia bacterium]|nr:spore germination protein [Limnochordia bacterium]